MLSVIDTETVPFGPANMAPPLVVLTVGDAEGACLVHWTEAEEVAWEVLRGTVVGHYVAYDMAVLGQQFPDLLPDIFRAYDEDRVTDTSIRQKLADLAAGTRRHNKYSLADVSYRLLGIQLAKGEDTWRTRYGELRHLPCEQWPEEARAYALTDVTVTARVYDQQSYRPDECRQARAAFWLHLMSCWGLTTDPVAVREFASRVQADYDRIESELVAVGLMKPKRVTRTGKVIPAARDTKAAMARMADAYSAQQKLAPTTATGRLALDDAACQESGDPLLVKYGEISSLAKRLSTDVPLLQQGLIHARFESLLETGRTSSSPNVQNLPRKGGMRECFIPRPGHVFIAADYGQIELRTLAQVCVSWFGHSKLADALNAGRDPHLEVAAAILGGLEGRSPAEIDDARQVGKVANFGFPGGLGPSRLVHFAKLSYGVELTESRARRLKQQWLEAWPEMRDYFRRVNELGDTYTQLYSGRTRGKASYCEICNGFFQGLAADLAKAAGWLIAKAMYVPGYVDALYGCRLVNFVHDEFIAEAPEDRANDAAWALANLMALGANGWLPDVPAIAEPVVMRRWYKGAKPVRVNGRLVPSKPGERKGEWIADM